MYVDPLNVEVSSDHRGTEGSLRYFPRECPACRERAAIASYRRFGTVTLFCTLCEHCWLDRERSSAVVDRRRDPARRVHDRRQASNGMYQRQNEP
jgi:hypothetical protein